MKEADIKKLELPEEIVAAVLKPFKGNNAQVIVNNYLNYLTDDPDALEALLGQIMKYLEESPISAYMLLRDLLLIDDSLIDALLDMYDGDQRKALNDLCLLKYLAMPPIRGEEREVTRLAREVSTLLSKEETFAKVLKGITELLDIDEIKGSNTIEVSCKKLDPRKIEGLFLDQDSDSDSDSDDAGIGRKPVLRVPGRRLTGTNANGGKSFKIFGAARGGAAEGSGAGMHERSAAVKASTRVPISSGVGSRRIPRSVEEQIFGKGGFNETAMTNIGGKKFDLPVIQETDIDVDVEKQQGDNVRVVRKNQIVVKMHIEQYKVVRQRRVLAITAAGGKNNNLAVDGGAAVYINEQHMEHVEIDDGKGHHEVHHKEGEHEHVEVDTLDEKYLKDKKHQEELNIVVDKDGIVTEAFEFDELMENNAEIALCEPETKRLLISIDDHPENNEGILNVARENDIEVVTLETTADFINFTNKNFNTLKSYAKDPKKLRIMTDRNRVEAAEVKGKEVGPAVSNDVAHERVIERIRDDLELEDVDILIYTGSGRDNIAEKHSPKDHVFVTWYEEVALAFSVFNDDIKYIF